VAKDWFIRRASPSDLEAILTLEGTCPEAPHWSRPVWQKALSQEHGSVPCRTAFVAQHIAGIWGFAIGTCAGDLAELESVAVSEHARRHGIGKALCLRVMEWSRETGALNIELEVRASSEGALALYRSLGFVEQGRRPRYYQCPTEDAVLMAISIDPPAQQNVAVG
jgi:ribosomal-protein-alanine N-acetyltransferase